MTLVSFQRLSLTNTHVSIATWCILLGTPMKMPLQPFHGLRTMQGYIGSMMGIFRVPQRRMRIKIRFLACRAEGMAVLLLYYTV